MDRRAEHSFPAAEMTQETELLGAGRYVTYFEKSIY